MPFKPVSTKVDFPAQEREILQWWKDTDAFNQLRKKLASSERRYSFLDGPITANNPMGVHHAWGRTYKDIWQRYYALKGYNQRWQNGFDCQGLWVEVNVERDLGFKTKRDIEDYGIAPFVTLCKQRVLNYAAIQTEQSIRLGYWVNWDDPDQLRMLRDKLGEDPDQPIDYHGPDGSFEGTVEQVIGQLGIGQLGGSYFTFSDENNYQIWGFLKKCRDHGWIYKGHDVMPWCWRCGTGISQHEIVTEGYVEKTDPGLTVRFPLVGHWGDGEPKESLLVWTTTPWTLTSNVAAAVGPELTYVKVKQGDEYLYLSKGTTKMLKGRFEVVEELKGRDMEGWRYHGPFDDLPVARELGSIDAHKVIAWDEVGEEEGTGIVHIAPGCGAEDFALGKRDHLPVIAPLDENGVYIDGFAWLTGMHVTDVTRPIVDDLKTKGRFYRLDDYVHRYPQCWRCQTPLIFRLVDEWYISMDGLRQPMIDVTNNIRWVPDFGKERELDWLRNMHDWMISKKRYYGLALPIWECADCGHFEIIGSKEELKERAVEGWAEFVGHSPHRPYIDAVKIKCEQCGALVERIKDVGNPWLDAGIVSMSTMSYRIDPDYWSEWFPADFITESFPGQFRNWFYALLAMATGVVNDRPTKTVLGFATLFGEDGRPMHKSWGNAIEFNEAADNIGADVMRWMFANQRYDTDMLFGYHLADETRRRFFIPLWNVYSFFVTYANLDGWMPAKSKSMVCMGYDKDNMALIGHVLETYGYKYVGATDRDDALNVLRREKPNVVLLDLEDGPQVYRRMAEDAATRSTPVVVIAGMGSLDRLQAFDWAATTRHAVIHGAFTADELMAAVRSVELQPLDRWIRARLHELIGEMTAALDDYDVPRAAKAAEVFVDDLSNWYVRRSRRRFWKSEADTDKQAAYATLYEVLVTCAQLLAPILPFMTEAMYQNLVRSVDASAAESIHHGNWPAVDPLLIDRVLLDDVAISRGAVTLGHSIRASSNIKVRQPLGKAIVVVTHDQRDRVERTKDIIADELNVKSVELAENEAEFVTYRLLPDNKKLGPKFGAKFPEVRKVLASADGFAVARAVRSGQAVTLGEFVLAPDEILVTPQPREGFAIASEGSVVVALDTHITPDLQREGYAREVVRRVQDLRKQSGFEISDHIVLTYQAAGEVRAAFDQWAAYIQSETLADRMIEGEPHGTLDEDEIDGVRVKLGVVKVP
jgi:isoleucyl-tRNA synthetase